MRRDRGFTLLEIAVTMAILGMVISVVYGVFAQTLAAKEHTESRANDFSSARTALNRIVADLQSAHVVMTAPNAQPGQPAPPVATPTPRGTNPNVYPADQPLFLARAHTGAGLAVDELAFSAFLRRPTAITFSALDLGIVHYFIGPLAPDSPRLALYREALYSLSGDSLDLDQPNVSNAVILVEDVVGLELRLFDGKDWLHDWDSTDTRNFAAAPQAVEVTLTLAKDRVPESYQTAADVPMARNLANVHVANNPNPPE